VPQKDPGFGNEHPPGSQKLHIHSLRRRGLARQRESYAREWAFHRGPVEIDRRYGLLDCLCRLAADPYLWHRVFEQELDQSGESVRVARVAVQVSINTAEIVVSGFFGWGGTHYRSAKNRSGDKLATESGDSLSLAFSTLFRSLFRLLLGLLAAWTLYPSNFDLLQPACEARPSRQVDGRREDEEDLS
jgi:hypothetical protein